MPKYLSRRKAMQNDREVENLIERYRLLFRGASRSPRYVDRASNSGRRRGAPHSRRNEASPKRLSRSYVTFAMLGRAPKVMIDKEDTTIISGAGKKVDIEARVAQLAALALVRTLSSTGVRYCGIGRRWFQPAGSGLTHSKRQPDHQPASSRRHSDRCGWPVWQHVEDSAAALLQQGKCGHVRHGV